jgi:Cys-tRNA(Pro)/Cys-tRNA(Cys) deacylase
MKKTNAVRILERHKVKYDLLVLPEKKGYGSAVDTAMQNGLIPSQIFKTLVTKGDKTGVVVAVVSGDKQLNFKKLSKATGNKKMAMYPLKDLTALTGYVRGGCSPLGMKKDFPVVLDETANDFDEIYVNAGKRGTLMLVKWEDLVRVCRATVAGITEEHE